jgi:hypothetical protein
MDGWGHDAIGKRDLPHDTQSVLDLMPEVSVVIGTMELVVPASDMRHFDSSDNDGLFDD